MPAPSAPPLPDGAVAAPLPASPAPAAPGDGQAAGQIDVPAEVVQELLDVALGSAEGQRVWRLWCRLRPDVQALGQLRVRINPGGLTVLRAPEGDG